MLKAYGQVGEFKVIKSIYQKRRKLMAKNMYMKDLRTARQVSNQIKVKRKGKKETRPAA